MVNRYTDDPFGIGDVAPLPRSRNRLRNRPRQRRESYDEFGAAEHPSYDEFAGPYPPPRHSPYYQDPFFGTNQLIGAGLGAVVGLGVLGVAANALSDGFDGADQYFEYPIHSNASSRRSRCADDNYDGSIPEDIYLSQYNAPGPQAQRQLEYIKQTYGTTHIDKQDFNDIEEHLNTEPYNSFTLKFDNDKDDVWIFLYNDGSAVYYDTGTGQFSGGTKEYERMLQEQLEILKEKGQAPDELSVGPSSDMVELRDRLSDLSSDDDRADDDNNDGYELPSDDLMLGDSDDDMRDVDRDLKLGDAAYKNGQVLDGEISERLDKLSEQINSLGADAKILKETNGEYPIPYDRDVEHSMIKDDDMTYDPFMPDDAVAPMTYDPITDRDIDETDDLFAPVSYDEEPPMPSDSMDDGLSFEERVELAANDESRETMTGLGLDKTDDPFAPLPDDEVLPMPSDETAPMSRLNKSYNTPIEEQIFSESNHFDDYHQKRQYQNDYMMKNDSMQDNNDLLMSEAARKRLSERVERSDYAENKRKRDQITNGVNSLKHMNKSRKRYTPDSENLFMNGNPNDYKYNDDQMLYKNGVAAVAMGKT